jgi:hypothetical protein
MFSVIFIIKLTVALFKVWKPATNDYNYFTIGNILKRTKEGQCRFQQNYDDYWRPTVSHPPPTCLFIGAFSHRAIFTQLFSKFYYK